MIVIPINIVIKCIIYILHIHAGIWIDMHSWWWQTPREGKEAISFYSKEVIRIYKIEGKSNKKRKTINNVNFFISTFWPSPDPGFCSTLSFLDSPQTDYQNQEWSSAMHPVSQSVSQSVTSHRVIQNMSPYKERTFKTKTKLYS